LKDSDAKRIAKYMVAALEPPLFKQRIELFLTMDSYKHYKKDSEKMHGWIRDKLRNFLEYSPVEVWKKKTESKKESSSGSKRQGGRVVQEKQANRRAEEGNRCHKGEFACLKCGSREHYVFRCSQVKDGEAEALLKERREKKQEKRAKSKEEVRRVKFQSSKRTVRRANLENSEAQSGADENKRKVRVRLEDCVDTEALLDSGTDCAMISKGLVEELTTKGAFVKMKTLMEPEIIGTTGNDIEVRRIVCLDSLVFQTSAGKLRWRGVNCFVDENDQGKLVVDMPTMEKMGYSPDALLMAAMRRVEAAGSRVEDFAAEARKAPQRLSSISNSGGQRNRRLRGRYVHALYHERKGPTSSDPRDHRTEGRGSGREWSARERSGASTQHAQGVCGCLSHSICE
jgi:hypothetical protein